jgi:hypothetical protein
LKALDLLALLALTPLLPACVVDPGNTGSDSRETDEDDDGDAAAYEFLDADGESTVSYAGQIYRHALLGELKDWMGSVSDRIADGSYLPVSVESVEEDLDLFFACDGGLCEDLPVGDDGTVQQSLGDIDSGKNLQGKVAGNDFATDHMDWVGGDFGGWDGADSPEDLVQSWFQTLATQAVDQVNGVFSVGPAGQLIEDANLTPEGLDVKQLTQKFLLGAIAYSQGVDDYLDDDTEGKGLLASHLFQEGKTYTVLEHAWDEAFGYFGAARNYMDLADEEIAGGDTLDLNADGFVDLKSEASWGHSINAAKRDKGASEAAPTDFTGQAWEGLVGGRQLLADTAGEALTADQFTALQGYRDQVVQAWEDALASTVVHYVNEVLQDMEQFGSSDYSFADHAKHWSEMKGFALGLQFNPRSSLGDTGFGAFHDLVGDAPVLPTATDAQIATYQGNLVAARALLGSSCGYDTANLGDELGENGW